MLVQLGRKLFQPLCFYFHRNSPDVDKWGEGLHRNTQSQLFCALMSTCQHQLCGPLHLFPMPSPPSTGAPANDYQEPTLMASRESTMVHATESVAPQGGLLATVGMLVAAVGVFFASKSQKKQEWAMTWVTAEPETTLQDMLRARQAHLASMGKGTAPRDYEKRETSLPGMEGPVDLEAMYAQFESALGDSCVNYVAGDRVTGTVYDVDDKGASIDFGGKEIGYCPTDELALCKVCPLSASA
jgi:hypothetical protein